MRDKIKDLIRNNVRRLHIVLFAMLSSILLTIAMYFYNNLPLMTGEDLSCYALAEWCRSAIAIQPTDTNYLYINVAYDRALTTYKPDGIAVGNIEITDREKLTTLLDMLSRTEYKYIFLDLRFEQGCESDNYAVDSALFTKIAAMPRIVCATHRQLQPMTHSIDEKVAYNDYYSTITSTNFVRYQYITHLGEYVTMPLFAYRELDKSDIKPHLGGLFYTSNSRLCYKSIFLNFPHAQDENEYVQLLGNDILCSPTPQEDLRITAHNKIVVIGDFTSDLHDTYSGMHAGPMIVSTAYQALKENKHLVSWWKTAFLFLLYFGIILTMFMDKQWFEYVPVLRHARFPLLQFVLSLIGYSAVMYMVAFIFALCFQIHLTLLLPTVCLSILSSYIKFRKTNRSA